MSNGNIFLVFPQEAPRVAVEGLYLYAPESALGFCTTALTEVLDRGYSEFAEITSVFTNALFKCITDGLGLPFVAPEGSESPIAVVDIAKKEVSFAPDGLEHDRDSWYSTLSFPEFVATHKDA